MTEAAENNEKQRMGELAGPKDRFGPFGRYAVAPVHTRFEAVEWFVWDAELMDPLTGGPAVIRQAATREAAVRGLET